MDITSEERSPFTFAAFSAANLARCEAPDGFNHAIGSWSLSDWFTAVVGELGEAANVAKKLNRVRDGITGNQETETELRARLRAEVADAFIYLDLLARSQGFALEDAVRETFDRKSEQIGYPHRLVPVPVPVPVPAPEAVTDQEAMEWI
jgi:NTP pyrophosphatase (non-canonical NTP hydrolase)